MRRKATPFEALKRYCARKGDIGSVYSVVVTWCYDLENARKRAQESLTWHSRMITECQQLPDVIEMHKSQVAAAQDILNWIEKNRV